MTRETSLRDLVGRRVVISYDTGLRLVGYVAAVSPLTGPVHLVCLNKARLFDAQKTVVASFDTLSVVPNNLVGLGPCDNDDYV